MTSINIIGMGNTGSSIAFALLHHPYISKIIVTDMDKNIAIAEYLDLKRANIIGEEEKIIMNQPISKADFYVICIGLKRNGHHMEQLFELNKLEVEKVLQEIKGYKKKNSVIFLVTNPVGRLAEHFEEYGVLPIGRLIDNATSSMMGAIQDYTGFHEDYPHKQIMNKIHKGKGYTNWSVAEEIFMRIYSFYTSKGTRTLR